MVFPGVYVNVVIIVCGVAWICNISFLDAFYCSFLFFIFFLFVPPPAREFMFAKMREEANEILNRQREVLVFGVCLFRKIKTSSSLPSRCCIAGGARLVARWGGESQELATDRRLRRGR